MFHHDPAASNPSLIFCVPFVIFVIIINHFAKNMAQHCFQRIGLAWFFKLYLFAQFINYGLLIMDLAQVNNENITAA